MRYLPPMNTPRRSHACSKYVTDNGETVKVNRFKISILIKNHNSLIQALMVVGGVEVRGGIYFTTTVEIMVKETWSYVASLPSPRYYHKAATLGNFVSVFGK